MGEIELIDFEKCKDRPSRGIMLIITGIGLWLGVYLILNGATLTLPQFAITIWGLFYPFYEIEIWDWIEEKEEELNALGDQL